MVFLAPFIREMASPEMMEVDDRPPSRPLTPNEQMDIMLAIETEDIEQTGIPTDRDLEVLCHSLQLWGAVVKCRTQYSGREVMVRYLPTPYSVF